MWIEKKGGDGEEETREESKIKNKTKQRRCGKIQKREGTKLNENYWIRIVCTGVMEV